ncbi:MAG: LacI family DNA-binding transcriptional regulator [Eubacteriales bacterium]|jgi:LacI family transcriptional regulator
MNISDIAKMAGVSPATVSRVLNGNARVKESTRQKVEEIIGNSNYSPNQIARNLSNGCNRNVAYFAPDVENPFFSKILHGITGMANTLNYNIFMIGTDEDPELEHRKLMDINRSEFCGVIITPVAEDDAATAAALKELSQSGLPIVLIDRDIQNGHYDGVFSDDENGAYEAVKLLICEGNRKIALISGPPASRPGRKRKEGYLKALHEYGIPVRDDYIINGGFKEDITYEAMKKLMALDDPPDSFFSSNNQSAKGVLRYLKENHIEIGRDVTLVTFDDIPELVYAGIDITVVDRPVMEMGSEAMRLLDRRLQGRRGPNPEKGIGDDVIQRSIVKTSLIVRGSERIQRRKAKGKK